METGHNKHGSLRNGGTATRRATIAMLLSPFLVGCGGKSDLAPVTGKVTYQGEPLKRGHIVFEPTIGRSARGSIVNGELIDVHTYKQGDGVRVGTHQVAITAFIREPKGMEIVPSAIPLHYKDPNTSGLTATIEAGKTNELLFELVAAKK